MLLVDLEQTYLIDLGLGDGYWRIQNHQWAVPGDYDFDPDRPDLHKLKEQCHEFQTDPGPVFVQNLVSQITELEHVTCLTGRILCVKTQHGTHKSLVAEEQFEELLADVFGIVDDEVASLWPSIVARHNTLFSDEKIENIEYNDF